MKKYALLILASLAMWGGFVSCEKEGESIDPSYITVSTDSILSVDETNAAVLVSVVPKSIYANQMGVCYGTVENPNILDKTLTLVKAGENQIVRLTGLTPNQLYHVRAFATSDNGVYYGKDLSFTTCKIKSPQVRTDSVYSIRQKAAACAITILSNGGDNRLRAGILLADHPTPSFDDRKISVNTDTSFAFVSMSYLEMGQTYYVRAFAINQVDTVYGNELSFTTIMPKKYIYGEGTIHGAFSISSSVVVGFSKGNLQYTASSGTWAFANKQYEICGSNNTKISSSYSNPIDLFGYGTSGYNNVYPYLSTDKVSYYPSSDIAKTESDWGVHNAIANGGNQVGLWRILTYKEWNYLLNTRSDATNLAGLAIVSSVKGLIILPNFWEGVEGISFSASRTSFADTYSAEEFEQLENAGAVFLPLCGARYTTQLIESEKGLYWTASKGNTDGYATYFGFSTSGISTMGTIKTCAGLSVRLVQDLVEDK